MVRLPYLTALTTLFSYGLLFAFGQLRDFFRKLIDWSRSKSKDLKVCALLPNPLLSHPVSLACPFFDDCTPDFEVLMWFFLFALGTGVCANLLRA